MYISPVVLFYFFFHTLQTAARDWIGGVLYVFRLSAHFRFLWSVQDR